MQDLLSNALAAVMVLMMLASAFAGAGKEFYKARGNKDSIEGRHALRRGDWDVAPAIKDDNQAPKYVWIHATVHSQAMNLPMLGLRSESGASPEYSYYRSDPKSGRSEHVFCVLSRQESEWTIFLKEGDAGILQFLVEVVSDDEELLRRKTLRNSDLPSDRSRPLVRVCRQDNSVLRVGLASQGKPADRCE